MLGRQELAAVIHDRLASEAKALAAAWRASVPVNHFVIDDVLPTDWAMRIGEAFPEGTAMTLKRSLREVKYVAAQMNQHDPLLEEAIYAFQAPAVVKLIEDITGLKALEPDELLYAGGISMMAKGHYLNPHVDNSHDKFRDRYRVLNLLYYISPGWTLDKGGNLELWQGGPQGPVTTILSKFNRLVVMVTHQHSWHSVSRSKTSEPRRCVSNYYFSKLPVGGTEYFHVTSFRGRPEQPIRDLVLRGDIWLRMLLRKFSPKGIRENPHYYRKL